MDPRYQNAPTPTVAPTDALTRAPPKPPAAKGRGRKRAAPAARFRAAAVGPTITASDTSERGQRAPDRGKATLDLSGLGDASAEADDVRSFVRERFGNHASEVLDVLRFGESFGGLFDE